MSADSASPGSGPHDAGRDRPEDARADGDIAPAFRALAAELEMEMFWQARPVLAHLHAFARARRVAPWALLGVTLARVVAVVPPVVVLPALVGSAGSLNLFVAVVGRSGAGKGTAESAAMDAVPLPGPMVSATVGSGEGIAHAYVRRTKDGVEQHTAAVLFSVPEIDTLTALSQRRGATLLPELRRAWVGEQLGFAYADPAKRLPVPAQAYRMALVAGVQPERADRLLADADGGTPQRFIWVPADDPHAPTDAPPEPGPWRWQAPRWPARSSSAGGRVVLGVCDQARTDVDVDRLARLRGDGHALDGHAMFARLKIAAALAILDGRAAVEESDWALAAQVAERSRATRQGVLDAIAAADAAGNRRRAHAEAERAVLVADRLDTAAVQRVARRLVRRLDGQGWVRRNDLRKACASADRSFFDAAIDAAVAAGQVEAQQVSYHGQDGVQYRNVTR